MAIANMIAATCYLFLVDLSKISMAYRIIAFMGLAIISIGISLYYNKKRGDKKPDGEQEVLEPSRTKEVTSQ